MSAVNIVTAKLCPPTPEDWDILTGMTYGHTCRKMIGLRSRAARAAVIHENMARPDSRDAEIMLTATLRSMDADYVIAS